MGRGWCVRSETSFNTKIVKQAGHAWTTMTQFGFYVMNQTLRVKVRPQSKFTRPTSENRGGNGRPAAAGGGSGFTALAVPTRKGAVN